jgi:hypothetical protein
MSKRLQVLLDEKEYREIRRMARLRRMTLAEWVRQALRSARSREPTADAMKKLAVIRAAASNAYPTADIEQMLAEIEGGYLGRGKQ